MSTSPQKPSADAAGMSPLVPPPSEKAIDGLGLKADAGYSEKVIDAIEMIGEEQAAGFRPPGHSEVTAGMRYLHSSRTIHQLVTDRNWAVLFYLGVASLLLNASSALYHASPTGKLIVPVEIIQRWCLPLTFGVLTVLAVFVAFLLIRTRVGLIYEVAKMNVLLGRPIGRVLRVNLLSIFFIMHAIISLAGGCSAGLFSVFMLHLHNPEGKTLILASLIGTLVTGLLVTLYVVTVLYTTSDETLKKLEA